MNVLLIAKLTFVKDSKQNCFAIFEINYNRNYTSNSLVIELKL